MKNHFFLFISIITIICIASNCKKEPENKTPYYIDQEIKDYVMFPEGSYWIYEDTVSGSIDSIYLIKSEVSMFEPNNDDFVKYEKLVQTFYSSLLNEQGYWNAVLSSKEDVVYSYVGFNAYFLSSKIVGYKKTDQIYYYSYFDSLNVNSEYFYNVKCMYSYGTLSYWARNIGQIKRDGEDDSYWILKKYFINN